MKFSAAFRFIAVIVTLCYFRPGDASAQSLDSLLSAYKRTTDPDAQYALLVKLGWMYQTKEAYHKAIGYYQDALKLKRPFTLPETRLIILKNLSFCYEELGDYANEVIVYDDILSIHNQNNNTTEKVKALQTLSGLMIKLKEFNAAVSYNERIIDIADSVNNYLWKAIAFNNLGFIHKALNDDNTSSAYFNKSYQIVKEQNIQLGDDARATILINLGVVNASLGKLPEAQQFLQEALGIRKKQNDTIKIAQALNYLGTYDYISSDIKRAEQHVQLAISLVKNTPTTEASQTVLAGSYQLLSEIMLRKNKFEEFKQYDQYCDNLQQQLIEKERRRNKLLMDHELDIERKENQIRALLSEKERQNFVLRESELEREKNENELLLKQNELIVLKQQNELQNVKFRNQALEKEKISQTLELVRQRADAVEQQQQLHLLQKDKELQKLMLGKHENEIQLLEKDKQRSEQVTLFGVVIIALLGMLLLTVSLLFINRNRKNRKLAEQSAIITKMNQEILMQNEELTTINDQLNSRTLELSERNVTLEEARNIINEQNEKLISYNKNLELEVKKRTRELTASNQQLVEYTKQLEQFAYALSHNLRAPLARILGLANIIYQSNAESERKFILEKIKDSAHDLDTVIADLHQILLIKDTESFQLEEVDPEQMVRNNLSRLKGLIAESGAAIATDFSQTPRIVTHGKSLDNILYNLISNAMKYRSPDRPCEIRIMGEYHNGAVAISISDNGLGMDLDQYGEKLFGLYKRFHPSIDGKGLGLYIVNTLVKALDGKIEVESSPDHGTTFRITLKKNHAFA
jgi:signal transduction histidine kinase